MFDKCGMPKLWSVLLRPVLEWINDLYIIDLLSPPLNSQTVSLVIHFTHETIFTAQTRKWYTIRSINVINQQAIALWK